MRKFSKKQSEFADNFVKNISILDLDKESPAEKAELTVVLKLISNSSNKRVLDLGCGTGRMGLKIANYTREVIGLDISKKSIAIANRTAKKYGIKNFRGIVGSIEDTEYKNYFDYVVMVSFIHHLDNPHLILRKIQKSLKPQGKIIVFELNPLNPLFIPFLIYLKTFKSHFNLGYIRSNIITLRRTLEKNGFKVEKIKKYGFLPTLLYNYSSDFEILNKKLNKTPIVNIFSAFHIILAEKLIKSTNR